MGLNVRRDLEVGGLSDFGVDGVDGDIVDTDRIGVHRLGNSVAQSDNAPAALKVKDEMAPLIAKDAEEKYDKIHGQGAWKVCSTLFVHVLFQFVLVCPYWLACFLQALPQGKIRGPYSGVQG